MKIDAAGGGIGLQLPGNGNNTAITDGNVGGIEKAIPVDHGVFQENIHNMRSSPGLGAVCISMALYRIGPALSTQNFCWLLDAPVYSVIALSRQAFCSYTFFIFSQRKDGENVAECYKTIEYPDRKAIAALYAAGAKAGQIAKEIGVAPRTIYAELKRGREGDKLDKNFRPSYDADLAQKRAQESLRRRGRRKGGPAE